MPWIAGPAFSALSTVSIPAPEGHDVQVLERFLVGAETDQARIVVAIEHSLTAADKAPAVPPDARGALLDAVTDFFALLAQAYGDLHEVVRDGHRRYADQTVDQWQPRLDAAAAEIEERGKVLLGLTRRVAPARERRHTKDRFGVALGFVVVALVTAGVMLYLVLHGWPMEPVPIGL